MIKHYFDLEQGSDEWLNLRIGLLTASEMKLIITPTLKFADNDKSRSHVYEIGAQRITRYVEPHYISDDMLRGKNDEVEARILYDSKISPVQDCGFITNDKWGFTIGYSPDGLVGDQGAIECKSRRQKYQFQTIIECVENNAIPDEFMLQIQTGLLVSEREWCDFVTFSGGMEMAVIRVFPDEKIQAAIIAAAILFEAKVTANVKKYRAIIGGCYRLIPTERKVEQEILC